ncbi:MAG: AraC family transcriptional regulator [Prolixibacteraceae bacterium]|jgi:AraC-like DNA-binding protein
MIIKKRYFKLPSYIIAEQQANPLTRDLYLCELAEILIKKETLWSENVKLDNHLLIFCTKGGGILQIASDMVPFSQNQYCIVPEGFTFKIQTSDSDPSVLYTCSFNGEKSKIMEKDFTVVRDLIPSVNNMVANRVMLFDELFNNLTKGFFNANYPYINLTFGHLLATFLYASKTSDDFLEEQNPGITRAIQFMEQNLDKKLSLNEIADEAGYSQSYLTTIFRKKTGYSPLSYFSHLKISKSCEYLDYSKYKIKEISFLMGYSDPYYFSKDFQKKIGLSPRNYRKRVVGKT